MKKVVFYGAIPLPDDIEDQYVFMNELENKIHDLIEDTLIQQGYTPDVNVSYEENSLDVTLRPTNDKYPSNKRRLIDAENLNWSGLHFTQAFAEQVAMVLSRQETVEQEIRIIDHPDNKPAWPDPEAFPCEDNPYGEMGWSEEALERYE